MISTLNSVHAVLTTPCSAALGGKARHRVYPDKLGTQTYTSIHSHTRLMEVLSFLNQSCDRRGALGWRNERVIALVAEKDAGQTELWSINSWLTEKSSHPTGSCYSPPPVFSPHSVFLCLPSFRDLQGHHCRFGLEVLVETEHSVPARQKTKGCVG